MKFCYIDESGTGREPYAVMVGVIVDAYRAGPTRQDWAELLGVFSALAGRQIAELHMKEFYPGNSPYRGISGPKRAAVINALFDWLSDRKHKVVYTAVDKKKFDKNFNGEACYDEVENLWRFMALHICLALQKHHQTEKKNKGNTVFVFDEHNKDEADFIELIKNPPKWTETYYSRESKQDPFDQVVDVPYFGDSRHVGLLQVADAAAYFLRRHLELTEGGMKPKYRREKSLVNGWARAIFDNTIAKSRIFPARGRCNCAELFCRYAPQCLL